MSDKSIVVSQKVYSELIGIRDSRHLKSLSYVIEELLDNVGD